MLSFGYLDIYLDYSFVFGINVIETYGNHIKIYFKTTKNVI